VLVRRANAADRNIVVDIAVAAFVTEPAFDYFFRSGYQTHSPSFLGYLFDYRLATGRVWVAEYSGDVASVAMWNTTEDVVSDEPNAYPEWATIAAAYPEETRERLSAYSQLLDEHKPLDAHFYLGVVATRPELQGNGLASAVLEPALREADLGSQASFLETGTESNVGFYRRLGFEVDAEIDLPDGPRIWWMRRPAKSK